jgi:uncharacterized protein YjeT (DUF2065 family)
LGGDTLWMAAGLVLVFEGLFPFIAPDAWRRMFMRIVSLRDGQIRFFGMLSVLAGLALLWFMS